MAGCGINPIATFRTAWDDSQAMYLALKGGKAASNHAHMDAGSFVFESDGVRWARDLDKQDYFSLEAKGIKLFDGKQTGARWTVFRLNNFSHNTLTINSQLHRVDGKAEITHFSEGTDAGAIVDLTPAFQGQASRVTRGFAFRGGRQALIRDEVEGVKAGGTVRWAIVTSAEIVIAVDGLHAALKQDGQQLSVSLYTQSAVRFEIASAQPPGNDHDAANPGVQLLIVNFIAPASSKLDWSVVLQPGSSKEDLGGEDKLTRMSLSNWPQPAVK